MNESPDQKSTNPTRDRSGFCAFLKRSRQAAKLSLDDIARITRIPERSLERLESGRFEELPADVFVRGFLRSYATCVGLDPEDALRRYSECGLACAPVASPAASQLLGADVKPDVHASQPTPKLARGTIDSAPAKSEGEAAKPAQHHSDGKKRRNRSKKRRKPRTRQIAKPIEANQELAANNGEADDSQPEAAPPVTHPEPVVVKPPAIPVLKIDDADPDRAEREQEKRARGDESRLTFLPPALLDTEDGSRRGALTLAVIILVIVATITMSYLLRRPSSSGDGVTQLAPASVTTVDAPAQGVDLTLLV